MLNKTPKPKPTGRKLVGTWITPEQHEAFMAAAEQRGGASKLLRDFVLRVIRSTSRAA